METTTPTDEQHQELLEELKASEAKSADLKKRLTEMEKVILYPDIVAKYDKKFFASQHEYDGQKWFAFYQVLWMLDCEHAVVNKLEDDTMGLIVFQASLKVPISEMEIEVPLKSYMRAYRRSLSTMKLHITK